MDSNDDNYIPRAAPAIQGYVYGAYPVERVRCELVFENAESVIFVRAFYTRWWWYPVNTRLVRKFWERVKQEHELDFLPDIEVLSSRGWILTNPYENTTRISASSFVKAMRHEPLYIEGFFD